MVGLDFMAEYSDYGKSVFTDHKQWLIWPKTCSTKIDIF